MGKGGGLIPAAAPGGSRALRAPLDPKSLLDSWLSGRKPTTLRTYQQGMDSFAQYLGVLTREEAASAFLAIKKGGPANQVVLGFKNWLLEKKFSTATIGVRLAAIRSLAQLGRVLGLIGWSIEITAPKATPYRDTRGPGTDKILTAVRALAGSDDPKDLRDQVLLMMLGTMGLRRGEAAALNIEDLDLVEKRLWYLGKARTDVEPMTIPDPVVAMIESWIRARGIPSGPLFIHYGKVKVGGRLSDRSIGRICHAHGLGRAHGLRHSAITRALDRAQGDVRKVAKFSRHKNIQTLLKYDDNRRDEGGEIARGLAGEL